MYRTVRRFRASSQLHTSNGTASGSGVVWVMRSGSGSSGTGAQLRAYSAIPNSQGVLNLLYSADIGQMAKFAVPATDGNHVYVGTRDGHVIGFGRPATSALTGSLVNFGNVATGSTATGTLTLTATRSLTVTGATTAAPFGVTAPTQPVSLAAGGTIQLPVSFSPTAAGATSGLVTVTIDAGSKLTFAVNGTGTAIGLQAQPATAAFVEQVVGTSGLTNVQVTNTGANDEVISAVSGPSGPFTVTGLPNVGDKLAGGGSGSFVIGVKYAPTGAGSDTSAVTITSTSGTLKIPLTGTSVAGSAHLVTTPSTLDFGSVDVGKSRTLNFDIANTGNIPTTITLAKAPAGVFSSSTPLSEGVIVGPGQVIHQAVTFAPTKVGSATPAVYSINSDSNSAIMNVQLVGVGTGPVPAPAADSWQLNGTTTMPTAGQLQLTPALNSSTGTAFFNTVAPVTGAGTVNTEGLSAKFNVTMNGGNGADGVAFAMLDPSKSTTKSIGTGGGGVGVSNLPGIAVMLQTWPASGVNNNNYVGVAQTTASGETMLQWAPAPSNLRSGSHPVEVAVVGGHVKVSVDGKALLDVVPPAGSLTPTSMIGFTGATGGLNDVHTVSNVAITTQVSGVGTVPVPAPAFGSWQFNGTTTLPAAGQLQLTPAVNNAAGTAFYSGAPVSGAVRTEGLAAKFTATMNGGTGADGVAFAMLDPTQTSPTAVGLGGGGLGVANLPGIAVMLQTYPAAGVSSSNYVGVARTTATGVTMLQWAAAPSDLRTGSHPVEVTVVGGHVKVSVDGKALLDVVPPAGSLPPTSMVGFTGATGGKNDVHAVSGVSITTTAGSGAPLTNATTDTSFGEVQLGRTGKLSVTLTNKSSQPEVVTGATGPGAPFGATLPSVGSTVPAGGSITVPVTFTPTQDGTFTDSLTVVTTSGQVVVPLTGSGSNLLPDLATSTWVGLGSTVLSGTTISLTSDGQLGAAGLMYNSTAVKPQGVHAVFSVQITGNHPTGADGLTFGLLDASAGKPTAAGGAGSGLGLNGLNGTFFSMATWSAWGINSSNYAGVGTTSGGTGLKYLTSTTNIPQLRSGTHTVDVTITTANHMVVKVDGTQVQDTLVSNLPPQVYVAFSGATGGATDTHAVINPVVSYTG